jgi:hypothetical protein
MSTDYTDPAPKWTREEIFFLKNNAGVATDKELTIQLNDIFGTSRKPAAVRKQRQRLGIVKANGRGRCEVKEVKNMKKEKDVKAEEKDPKNPAT